MTGPEHYREAEKLLVLAARQSGSYTQAAEAARADAQVHATLALAAAQAHATFGVQQTSTKSAWLAVTQ